MCAEKRTVSELGEDALVELVTSLLPRPPADELWSGDDAALVSLPIAGAIVTTDTIVEGVDFDLAYCDGADVGWKALAINVSDVAAMAGRPTHAVATLTLPPSTPVELVEGIARGLADAARRWDVAVVGGDLGRAPVVGLSVTLLGAPAARRVVVRRGARPRDIVCVTGALGGSWGGLQLLRRGLRDRSPELVARHLRPTARVEEGRRLSDAGATALMDVSDGLAVDLTRMMRASGTGCRIDPAAVPVDPDLDVLVELGLAREEDLLDGAILGGEDYELLATVPRETVRHLPVTAIGEVTAGPALELGDRDLEELGRDRGWDHLRGR